MTTALLFCQMATPGIVPVLAMAPAPMPSAGFLPLMAGIEAQPFSPSSPDHIVPAMPNDEEGLLVSEMACSALLAMFAPLPLPGPVPAEGAPPAGLSVSVADRTPASPISRSAAGNMAGVPINEEEESTSPSAAHGLLMDKPPVALRNALQETVTALPGAFSLPQRPASGQAILDLSAHVQGFRQDNQWIDQLARDIAATAMPAERTNFRLLPPHLGRLDVEVMRQDEGIRLHIRTQTEEAGQIVTAAEPQLLHDLERQGVRVIESRIAREGGHANSHPYPSPHGQPAKYPFRPASLSPRAEMDERDAFPADRRGRFA